MSWSAANLGSERVPLSDGKALHRYLQARLDAPETEDPQPPEYRAAAVLVPVVAHADGADLMFLRRPETMREHRGQIAFPGGRIDPGETPVVAALREAHEELGLAPDRVEVLGRVPGIATVTNYWVHPVVAWVEAPVSVLPNPREVDETFFADLARLSDPRIYRATAVAYGGRRDLIDYFHYPHPALGERIIWGATGRVLRQLLGRVLDWTPSSTR